MRKLLISLLLASAVATPAVARPHDDNNDNRPARSDRSQPREESHSDRAVQRDRSQFTGGNHFDRSNGGGSPGGQQPFAFRQHVQEGGQRNFDGQSSNNNDGQDHRNWRGPRREQVVEGDHPAVQDRRERFGDRDRFDNDALRHSDRQPPQVMRTRVPVVSTVPRPGTQPPMRFDNHRRGDVRWDPNWRRDGRYDWRNWRDRHRSSFHLGIYYDPFGWGYQPFSIGWRLWPNYYSSRYWISDPWQYRLPYAPPGTQWVRYYNDALLVDVYTGQVVDVLYNFFW
jgi:hypothetical protein